MDPQADHVHMLSAQKPRKTKKDGALGRRQTFSTDSRRTREKQTFKSPAVKSSTSLEIQNKDSEIVNPLPPPLVRNYMQCKFKK